MLMLLRPCHAKPIVSVDACPLCLEIELEERRERARTPALVLWSVRLEARVSPPKSKCSHRLSGGGCGAGRAAVRRNQVDQPADDTAHHSSGREVR